MGVRRLVVAIGVWLSLGIVPVVWGVRDPVPGSVLMCVTLPTYPPRTQEMLVPPLRAQQYLAQGTATPGACEAICPLACATAVNTVLSQTTLTQVQCTGQQLRATASTGGGLTIAPTACSIQGMTGQTVLSVPLAPLHYEACVDFYVPVVEALGFDCDL